MSTGRIEVPKNLFGKYKKKKKNNLVRLEESVIKAVWRYNQYGFVDPTEEKFLEENKGKNIIVQLANGKDIEATLESIDKYRICVVLDSEKIYYYKHAIISYYAVV